MHLFGIFNITFMKKFVLSIILFASVNCLAFAQVDRWQQRVVYSMNIDMDVDKNQFTGNQQLEYFNNSPDTLRSVFYHLYFNAFQPGSSMDVRSRSIKDPDNRVRDRIYGFDASEIGYHRIKSLQQDGQALKYHIEGTILEVKLNKPILPKGKSTFNMVFESQVPLQTRRSGRDNDEGIRLSMAQWYPKMAEYDRQGWHTHPYIAREFYAPWGDFDVKISIDKNYVIGGTGYLQNPNEIGFGYETPGTTVKKGNKEKLTWHFKAPNVHDFMWAADPDYAHDMIKVPDGPNLHFFYQRDTLVDNWKKLQPTMVKAFQFMNEEFGKYPYESYSFIQGGDGGMEYPMATLITGHRSYRSLVGVSVHEAFHSWYQMVLATNESYFGWMDEGFTSYASDVTMLYLFDGQDKSNYNKIAEGSYKNYFALAASGLEEPLSTHSDHFNTNYAYGRGSYNKGAVSLHQLGYIIGQDVMRSGLLRYYNTWKLKHPDKNDFIRIMEKHSGLELDWYYEYWINTTHTIDYSISNVTLAEDKAHVTLERIGVMPMPIDLEVTYDDGSTEMYHIPLDLMRGEKKLASNSNTVLMSDWPWVNQSYKLTVGKNGAKIKSIVIDPSESMADVDRKNNSYPNNNDVSFEGQPLK
jgi:hypothetical protein